MHKRTDLAAGPINGSDRLTVELIQPADTPGFVAINWQQLQPSRHQRRTPLWLRRSHGLLRSPLSP